MREQENKKYSAVRTEEEVIESGRSKLAQELQRRTSAIKGARKRSRDAVRVRARAARVHAKLCRSNAPA
jgi:hypothetical protein